MNFLFSVVVCTAYAFSLTVALISATMVDLNYADILIPCIIVVIVLSVFLFNKYSIAVGSALLATSALVLFFMARRDSNVLLSLNDITEKLKEIVPVLQGSMEMNLGHQKVIVQGIVLLVSVFSVLNIGKFFNAVLPIIFGFAVMIIPGTLGYVKSELALFIFLACFIIILVKRLNLFVLKDGNATFALIAIPLSFLVLLAAYNIPKPNIGTKGSGSAATDVIKQAADAVEQATTNTSKGSASLSKNGKILGGTITMGDEVVMRVASAQPVYLVGAVYDTYSGKSWTTAQDAEQEIFPNENGAYIIPKGNESLAESQTYVMNYYGFDKNSVQINMRENRTYMIFSPPSNLELSSMSIFRVNQNTHGVLSSQDVLFENTQYSQEYIAWNYNDEYFQNYLRERNLTDIDKSALPELETCLELPSLPDRLVTLTKDVTKNATNDYDKIKAIEEFLAAFPYTLETSNVPSGEDFVDYFIFTEKQGYCVYYATALAVMGRLEGIPTRYVEGYVMPPERQEDSSFLVTGKQAHAWTEVYFDGFGWVRFEPTSPYYAQTYQAEVPEQETQVEDFEDIQDEEDTTDEEPDTPEEDITDPKEELEEKKSYTGLIITLSAALVLGASVFVVWKKLNSNKKFWEDLDKEENREAVITYYAYTLKAKEALNKGISENETARSFAARLVKEGDADSSFVDVTNIFLKAAYSQDETTDKQRKLVEDYYFSVLEEVKANDKLKVGYYINRYFLRRY